jgi:site-specific DNA-methyltransferase (adenine-specific)
MKKEINNCTLHLGDCMEYMSTLSDKTFDLAVVDPPYGMGEECWSGGGVLGNRKYIKTYKEKNWDNFAPNSSYFDELFRVSKNQIIWGGNYFGLPPTRGIICWDKEQPMPSLSDWEMAWTSFQSLAKIWRGRSQDPQRIHPTQKPVKLYEWLLTNYAKPNQRILDTHLGSGSSAIAAAKLGFEFVGCEIDADYFNAACKRIEEASKQVDMFVEQPKATQEVMF